MAGSRFEDPSQSHSALVVPLHQKTFGNQASDFVARSSFYFCLKLWRFTHSFVKRKYGLISECPGKRREALAASIEGGMMTSSPGFQFAGVQMRFESLSCKESTTLRISLKLRPVEAGYVIIALILLVGSIINTERTVNGIPVFESTLVASW